MRVTNDDNEYLRQAKQDRGDEPCPRDSAEYTSPGNGGFHAVQTRTHGLRPGQDACWPAGLPNRAYALALCMAAAPN